MTPRKNIFLSLLWAIIVQSCTLIDDDLSNCGLNYMLNYEMRLETNMQMELKTVLNAEEDQEVADALRKHLSTIFSDHAHDVDLSFFSSVEGNLKQHLFEVVDTNRSSFSFYLPREEYLHLSVANMQNNEVATLTGTEYDYSMFIRQPATDTVESHQTGLFSARLPMEVVDTTDQVFDVTLYMINSAVALVIDTARYSGNIIESYAEGMADAFFVKDSVFMYSHPHLVRGEEVIVSPKTSAKGLFHAPQAKTSTQACFTSVSMPSGDTPDADGVYWRLKVYVRLPDNTITENIISVSEQLKAGQLKIIKTQMQDNGVIVPVRTTNVGVSVELDWKPGSEYEPWLGAKGR